MDNQTIVNTLDQDEQRGRILKIVLLGAAFAVICLLFSTAFVWFQPDQLSLSERYFPSPTAAPTGTPKPTATPNVAATQRIIQSTASAQAVQTTIANAGSQWPILFSDTFDNNDTHWTVGTIDDDYSKITREIKDGKYIWDATAKQGFIGWVTTNTESVSDFYLSAEFEEINASAPAQYGLAFREDTQGNFYYFAVEEGGFLVALTYNQQWIDMIGWKVSSLIKSEGTNRLTVIAEGSHFIFLINGQYVGEATNDRLAKGTTALVIGLNGSDSQAVVEFDNLELRTP